jgi:hypothetical protein
MRYQRSFPLPPKTVLSGLLGAALGYNESEVAELAPNILSGIVEVGREGIAKDLWRITKVKPGLEPETAVLIKEYLVHPKYLVYYSTSNERLLQSWKDSLTDPAFPLTLGSSDDMCIVRAAEIVDLQNANAGTIFKSTILPFNYKKRKTRLATGTIKSGTKLEMPQIFSAPMSFQIDGGVRKGKDQLEFTYVSTTPLELDDVQGAWSDGVRSFFMF